MGRTAALVTVSALVISTGTTGPSIASAFNVNPRAAFTAATAAAQRTHTSSTPGGTNKYDYAPASMSYANVNVNINTASRHTAFKQQHQRSSSSSSSSPHSVLETGHVFCGGVGGRESTWVGSPVRVVSLSDCKRMARRRAGGRRSRGREQGGLSMMFGDQLDYVQDYKGPRLWPKYPVDLTKDWAKCEEMVELGGGLKVSKVGVGCAAFGGRIDDVDDVAEILDYAFDRGGINWLDTSESYPFPLLPGHKFKADPLIGEWLGTRERSEVILSTKVAGHMEQCKWLRKDKSITKIDRDYIMESVEGSLKRLQTDYIDILHMGDWPERLVPGYAAEYHRAVDEHEPASDIEEQLMAVQELVDQGMVRHVAVANENAYGVTKFCEHADWDDLPRIVSVQAQYNLVSQHKVERALLEACSPLHENVPIIAVLPLGGGGLTGKYMNEDYYNRNQTWRMNKYRGWNARYDNAEINKMYKKYAAIAARYGMTLHQMAIAYVNTRPFIRAMLIGATSAEQLSENLSYLKYTIPDECLKEIITLQDELIEPTLGKVVLKPIPRPRVNSELELNYETITPPMYRGDVGGDESMAIEEDYPRSFSTYIKEENLRFIPDVPEDGPPAAGTPHPSWLTSDIDLVEDELNSISVGAVYEELSVERGHRL